MSSQRGRLYAAVSSSAAVWSVWLGTAVDDPLAGQAEIAGERGRPRNLLATLQALLGARGAGLGDVAGFALDVGPGSFTGLRSGMAAVRALAWAQSIPVCAVPCWHAMAYAAQPGPQQGVLCAVRARAGVWYLARWPDRAPQAVAMDDVDGWLRHVARPGDRTAGCAWLDQDLARAAAAAAVQVSHSGAGDCDARSIATVALAGPSHAWTDAIAAIPSYVADSEAENRPPTAPMPPCSGLPERAQ